MFTLILVACVAGSHSFSLIALNFAQRRIRCSLLNFKEAVLILIALGANLPSVYGSPLKTLMAAIECIDSHEEIAVVRRSAIYKSAPVPISDQLWYHNAVIAVETGLKPFTLLAVLQEIEINFGRERAAGERNAARTLDLDIPHPRMSDRGFVLFPLSDVSPEWKHPITGAFISKMIEALPKVQDIHKIEEKCDA